MSRVPIHFAACAIMGTLLVASSATADGPRERSNVQPVQNAGWNDRGYAQTNDDVDRPPPIAWDESRFDNRSASQGVHEDQQPAHPHSLPPRDSERAARPLASQSILQEATPASHSNIPLRISPPGEARTQLGGNELSPLVTAAGSLGIVLGLFLLVVWAVRRGMPKPLALLPRDVVEVLGRVPLVGRHHVHLVRCGNKILMLSVTPSSVEALAEITDPIEVDRLAGLCQQSNPHSATTSFRNEFAQFDKAARGSQRRTRRGDDLGYANAGLELGARHEMDA